MKLKVTKCSFPQSEVKLSGRVVNNDGIQVYNARIKAIVDAPAPRNATELRGFLGFDVYYKRFIRNFSKSSAVLHMATSGKREV